MRRRAMGALALGLALALPVAGLAFDAEYTASQTVTISQAGSYLVTGTGGGSVTVSANVTGAELTISNVTWTGNATKIDIGDGAAIVEHFRRVASEAKRRKGGDDPEPEPAPEAAK